MSLKTSPPKWNKKKHKIGSHPTFFMRYTPGKINGWNLKNHPNWKGNSSEPNFPNFRLQPVNSFTVFWLVLWGWILWLEQKTLGMKVGKPPPGSWNHATCWRCGWSCSPWKREGHVALVFWAYLAIWGHWIQVQNGFFRAKDATPKSLEVGQWLSQFGEKETHFPNSTKRFMRWNDSFLRCWKLDERR